MEGHLSETHTPFLTGIFGSAAVLCSTTSEPTAAPSQLFSLGLQLRGAQGVKRSWWVSFQADMSDFSAVGKCRSGWA